MNPRPTRESYKDFYKNLFWEQKITNTGFRKEGQMWRGKRYKWDNDKKWDPKEGKQNRMEKHREQRANTIIPAISKAISLDENTDILEVGAGFGVTLDEFFKRYKCRVYAIEPSGEAKRTMKELGNINILASYAEDLEEIENSDIKFDVIIFSHSLENTNDPLRVITFAKSCLKDNGVIYIQTPNLLVFDQMNPYHPFIFSGQSLRVLAEKTGFVYGQISSSIEKMLCVILKKYEKDSN
jgi:2-polyprenyl-3-methyl-5-hydroxy-6-metoxy-1,4-benzoquinol methylase